jgi:hypothetical protein
MNPLSGVLGEAWALYRRFARHLILISFAIYLVGMFLLQAALVKAVQDVRDGRVDLDLRGTIQAASPYIGAVAIASILASCWCCRTAGAALSPAWCRGPW